MKVEIPQIGFEQHIECYANKIASDQLAIEGFDGMMGLPILQQMIYGVNNLQSFLEM
jgi:hypothetical protein